MVTLTASARLGVDVDRLRVGADGGVLMMRNARCAAGPTLVPSNGVVMTSQACPLTVSSGRSAALSRGQAGTGLPSRCQAYCKVMASPSASSAGTLTTGTTGSSVKKAYCG